MADDDREFDYKPFHPFDDEDDLDEDWDDDDEDMDDDNDTELELGLSARVDGSLGRPRSRQSRGGQGAASWRMAPF